MSIEMAMLLASPVETDIDLDTSICCECGLSKPFTQFPSRRSHRKHDRCNECERRHRSLYENVEKPGQPKRNHDSKKKPCKNNCGSMVSRAGKQCWSCYVASFGPKDASTPAPKPTKQVAAALFKCISGCGAKIRKEHGLCSKCQKNRQLLVAASQATHSTRNTKLERSVRNGTSYGIIYIGHEPMSMTWLCANQNCRKPMLFQGRCYRCATGRERTLQARVRTLADLQPLHQATG